MKIQKLNPKILSITQIRKDIDVLKEVLEDSDEAWIMRNQNILFIAVTPERYKKLMVAKKREGILDIESAVESIKNIQKKYKRKKGQEVSSYVSKMRDQRSKKWKQ